MQVYVVLFRGINVGGRRRLPMKELKQLLQVSGCVDVQTYIQSGNVVCRSATSSTDRLAKQIAVAVSRTQGFEPRVLVLTLRQLERAAGKNPFPEAADKPKSLHLFFLSKPPKQPDLTTLGAVQGARERFVLDGAVAYLHAPDGFGTSKLAARAEQCLGVEATARNWRTVTSLLDMARALG